MTFYPGNVSAGHQQTRGDDMPKITVNGVIFKGDSLEEILQQIDIYLKSEGIEPDDELNYVYEY